MQGCMAELDRRGVAGGGKTTGGVALELRRARSVPHSPQSTPMLFTDPNSNACGTLRASAAPVTNARIHTMRGESS